MCNNLFLHEITEGRDALGMAKLLREGEEDGHLLAFHVGQDAHQMREIFHQVIRQNPNTQIVDHRLQRAEVVVHRQGRCDLMAHQFLDQQGTGGDLRGLKRSIRRGLCGGPRIVSAGHMISQTGGHGDVRGAVVDPPACGCQIVTSQYAHVADGPDAVRKAARQCLRDGSDFLKIHTSGGVASPMDPLDSVQYTATEVAAIVTEAEHRHTYVTAHAYSSESMLLAAENGVACLEHGNLVDAATASHLAGLGTTVVPTLVTYWAFRDHAEKFGFPKRNQAKNDGLFEQGRAAIGLFRDAGVELGFGTDLLGEAQPYQNQEFAIRAELEPAADVLRSMYVTNVRLCDLEGKVGTVSPGAYGDLVVTDVDPLEDLAALADPEAALAAVVQSGHLIVDRLDG